MSNSLTRLVNRALGQSQVLGVAVPSRYAAPAQQLAPAPNPGARTRQEEEGAPDDTGGESEAGWLHGARALDRSTRSPAGLSLAFEPPQDPPDARPDRQGAAGRSEEGFPPPGSPHPTVGEPRKRMSGDPLASQPRPGARANVASAPEGAPAPALPRGEASRGAGAPVAAPPMLPLGEMSRNAGARSAIAPQARLGDIGDSAGAPGEAGAAHSTVVGAIPAYPQALAARGGVTGPADAASDKDDAMWQRLLGPTRASAALTSARSMEAAAAHDTGRASRRGDDAETSAGERAPQITISIDRLDVHGLAAASQPAPVARPRRGPRLTLSEYMKSQGRGGPGR